MGKCFKEEYDKNPKKCRNCESIISYKKRENNFCNRTCSAIFNNKKISKRKKEKHYINECLSCGKIARVKFCNVKCQSVYKQNKTKKLIEENNICKDSKIAKRYLIEKFGNVCQICGITDWMNKPLVLILDHIDGDSSNNCMENQRLICSNCDSQTPTYKGKNRGNGRHSRKMRYREGKSF